MSEQNQPISTTLQMKVNPDFGRDSILSNKDIMPSRANDSLILEKNSLLKGMEERSIHSSKHSEKSVLSDQSHQEYQTKNQNSNILAHSERKDEQKSIIEIQASKGNFKKRKPQKMKKKGKKKKKKMEDRMFPNSSVSLK